MISTLLQRQGQFKKGLYLLKGDQAEPEAFQYEETTEKEKKYNQMIQNLISEMTTVVIKTNYRKQWMNQGIIILQDGYKYIIERFKEVEEEVNPQAVAILKENINKSYIISLIQCMED